MRKAFGAFVVGAMMFAGLALPLTIGDTGSAHAFCPPGKSGLNGTLAGNFPAIESAGFGPEFAGWPGPWNSTDGGGGASKGHSRVQITCSPAPDGPHAA